MSSSDKRLSDARHPTQRCVPERSTCDQSFDASEDHIPTQHFELMPTYSVELPFTFTLTHVLDVFKQVSARHHFQVIAEGPSFIEVAAKSRFTFRSLFKCCLTAEENPFETRAKLSTSLNEETCMRQVSLRGLCGSPLPIAAVVHEFSTRLHQLRVSGTYEVLQDEEDDEDLLTCKNATNSYYEICKILSSDTYSLGKSVSEFAQAFASQWSDATETASLLPQPTQAVQAKVHETVQVLFHDYNYGRCSAERVMLHCRPAVEKFFFGKVGSVLRKAYKARYSEEDRRVRLAKTASPGICEVLGMRPELRVSFSQALGYASRLPRLCSPTEKFAWLDTILADAKAEILECSRAELSAEEQSVVLAYVLLASDIEAPMAELMLVKDWKETDKVHELLRVIEGAVMALTKF